MSHFCQEVLHIYNKTKPLSEQMREVMNKNEGKLLVIY